MTGQRCTPRERPTDEATLVADNFCTIIKVAKDISAIPQTDLNTIHNPVGIDVHVESLTSLGSTRLPCCYNSQKYAIIL